MIHEVLDSLIDDQKDLTMNEASKCMDEMITGTCDDATIAAFLIALRIKKETVPEITGFAKTMKEHSVKVNFKPNEYMLDTAGTGGDTFKTFNVTTAASIIASSGGVLISKHGNRSVSSKCGGADVLEALGVNIETTPEQVSNSLEHTGFGFIFAPKYHPATKNVMGLRRALNTRTVFNILGPLTCPANTNAQIMGIFDPEFVEPIAGVLDNLGIKRAMVVHGFDEKGNTAMDEISIIGKTKVSFLDHGEIETKYITPEDFNCTCIDPKYIKAPDTIEDHVKIIKDILNDKYDTKAEKGRMDLCLMNSASMLYIAKKVDSLAEGVDVSRNLIQEGLAKDQLTKIIEYSTAEV